MVEAERGYLIVAVNTENTDYIRCARVLAKSIRYWQPDAKVCLVTDHEFNDQNFDFVKKLPYGDRCVGQDWKLANDWQIFSASPFRQTIKLEADMVLTGSVDHWWPMLEKRDVVIATGCRNFYNQVSDITYYRKAFIANKLPDVYNAFTYWRVSKHAKLFFDTVKLVFNNWSTVKTALTGIDAEHPDTDTVYAIAATIVGVNTVTLPNTTYPSFIHLKGRHNFCLTEQWINQLVWEFDTDQLRINSIAAEYPVHYHNKEFAKTLEIFYDKLLESSI